ncbi:tautomerase family protein [Halanaerobium congolense]|uniref:Tautomerase-like protein n=1 Tax=Halanaerobium congolense TaxID=54121 RepID=A0A318EF89_9FIRM|nr:tautomerase family protein [Halanaerobium congolense]PXV68662.1 tautomerase-like protein [Halanaerobium congolense]TDS30676.1 tautomerase-like protein [Halanaerobium congolense]SDH46374.1 Tautomerase enzyme [Halanaerobium congolense]
MPHIVFDGPELSKEQKKELIKNFTDTASKVTNIPNHKLIPLYCIVYNSLLHPSHNKSIQQTTPHPIIYSIF